MRLVKARCLVEPIRKKDLRNLSALFASSDRTNEMRLPHKYRPRELTRIRVLHYFLTAILKSLEAIAIPRSLLSYQEGK